MTRIVVKFGGTSIGSFSKIKNAAKIIEEKYKAGNEIIVVVSAMSGVTNDLIEKSNFISKNFDKCEYDVLLSTGEQVSSALISGSLIDLGLKSRSWLGWQVPIITENNHGAARILEIKTDAVINYISGGGIPVISGFQGISKNGQITTISRGGSDTSAVIIAKFFSADECIIYTDVEGVMTTDPSINSKAKKIDKISYEEMLEMSSLGAKVMQPSSVQAAMTYDIPVQVKPTFSTGSGTQILSEDAIDYNKIITGIAYSKNDSKITLVGVVDRPGVAASIFEPLSKSNINVDMVVQNISSNGKETDITFTVKREDLKKTLTLIEKNKSNFSYKRLIYDDRLSKVSIIGAGMITNPGVTFTMFKALADEGINILVISTSEIKISVLINEELTQKAVKVLHKAFNLD